MQRVRRQCYSSLSTFISAIVNISPCHFFPCVPQVGSEVRDQVPALSINSAKTGHKLGGKVRVADLLLGFEQRGGVADGFRVRGHPGCYSLPISTDIPLPGYCTSASAPFPLAKTPSPFHLTAFAGTVSDSSTQISAHPVPPS